MSGRRKARQVPNTAACILACTSVHRIQAVCDPRRRARGVPGRSLAGVGDGVEGGVPGPDPAVAYAESGRSRMEGQP